ncbi:MAG: acyl-CoA dehydrogenase family protein, partial [Blastocatellia bacterium]
MPTTDVDFFKLDTLLSDEEKLARQSVRSFVEDRVRPIIAECFEEGRFPRA